MPGARRAGVRGRTAAWSSANRLALFVLIGSLSMTQALHLSVTALLVPLLAVVTGLTNLRSALAPFAHPIIFLFLVGFALAAALRRQGLDRVLAAVAVLRLASGRLALTEMEQALRRRSALRRALQKLYKSRRRLADGEAP